MDSTEKTYFQLTGVNLDVEKRIWDERGKGYYGEYLVFRELYLNIVGNCKLLMNLHIPVDGGRTTEIDLLMIHETGVYVFEVKHYKGTIYGDSEGKVWTQYFRTAKNSVFENPIHQNGYHIRALSRLLPDTPIYSVIVFTNNECVLNVDNHNPHLWVTSLRDLISNLLSQICCSPKVCTADQINSIFCTLAPYSPGSKLKVPPTLGTEASFYEYIAQFKHDMDAALVSANERASRAEEKAKLQIAQAVLQAKEKADNAEKAAKNAKKHWRKRFLIFAAILTIVVFSISFNYMKECNARVEKAEKEFLAMQQNFQHIDAYADEYLQLIDGMIQVSEIQLEMSHDLKNTAIFSCNLANNAEDYGIMFNKDTKYIIILKNGTVQEYSMYGDRLAFSYGANLIGGTKHSNFYRSSRDLLPLEIYSIPSLEEISYIKLANISLWKWGANSNNSLKDGLELELYSASLD